MLRTLGSWQKQEIAVGGCGAKMCFHVRTRIFIAQPKRGNTLPSILCHFVCTCQETVALIVHCPLNILSCFIPCARFGYSPLESGYSTLESGIIALPCSGL